VGTISQQFDKLLLQFKRLCPYVGQPVVNSQASLMAPNTAKRDLKNDEPDLLGRKAFSGPLIWRRYAILCRTEAGARVSREDSRK